MWLTFALYTPCRPFLSALSTSVRTFPLALYTFCPLRSLPAYGSAPSRRGNREKCLFSFFLFSLLCARAGRPVSPDRPARAARPASQSTEKEEKVRMRSRVASAVRLTLLLLGKKQARAEGEKEAKAEGYPEYRRGKGGQREETNGINDKLILIEDLDKKLNQIAELTLFLLPPFALPLYPSERGFAAFSLYPFRPAQSSCPFRTRLRSAIPAGLGSAGIFAHLSGLPPSERCLGRLVCAGSEMGKRTKQGGGLGRHGGGNTAQGKEGRQKCYGFKSKR